jgi:hypothetical protein
MNRPFYTSASNSSNSRQPLSQAPPPTKQPPPSIHERFHSRNTSDPQDYHRRPPHPPPPPLQPSHYNDDDDTEDADEEEDDSEMTAYSSRSGPPNASGNGSRPGSSSKDSTGAIKKQKTKSTKVFQCTGYGDCTMQFTRSEHLARHIRFVLQSECVVDGLENIRANVHSIATVGETLVVSTIFGNT